jgi:hypothetical protein
MPRLEVARQAPDNYFFFNFFYQKVIMLIGVYGASSAF